MCAQPGVGAPPVRLDHPRKVSRRGAPRHRRAAGGACRPGRARARAPDGGPTGRHRRPIILAVAVARLNAGAWGCFRCAVGVDRGIGRGIVHTYSAASPFQRCKEARRRTALGRRPHHHRGSPAILVLLHRLGVGDLVPRVVFLVGVGPRGVGGVGDTHTHTHTHTHTLYRHLSHRGASVHAARRVVHGVVTGGEDGCHGSAVVAPTAVEPCQIATPLGSSRHTSKPNPDVNPSRLASSSAVL
mmetsp:Transcript_4357/g.11069  ORF Transcript_4357/g.11069 Transcript_4357/m.11069 type:complete len:243 (+) Transcript_4357:639-1367(+)